MHMRTAECGKVDMFFGLFMDAWNEGFDISSNMLKKLSDRNIKISFDIYSSTDDKGFDNVEDQAHGEQK